MAVILRNMLANMQGQNIVITQVFTKCEETNLFGVTVVSVETDFVIFSGAGSGAGSIYYIRLVDIVGIEL
ncbi:uncharacterized protein (DUF1684 family) [Fictibacillus halophilus]|uniref:Uncharacterized protein (DUF1684 family) n=1 Tax=Fictibacillus halophilus TaxID=1610490 RepID=A0ABV2LNE3_9BACL|nr:hypothetical protein [Fictibacillus halophilus]